MEPMEPRALPKERCGDVAQLESWCTKIEALSVVNGRVRFDEKHNGGTGRIQVNVWCRSTHSERKDKQPYFDLNNRKAGDDARRSRSNLGCGRTEAPHTHRDQACRLRGGS